jgi:hypothetical protein
VLLQAFGGLGEQRELEILIVGRGELDAPAVKLHELAMIVAALVELDERIEGEGALAVELESTFVRARGALRVFQHVALGLADAAVDGGAFAVVGDELRLPFQDLHDRRPVGQERGQHVHRVERLGIGLVQRKQAFVGGERSPRVVPLLVVQRGERRKKLPFHEHVGRLDRLFVGVGERVP